jgi:P27 family predicted phage terminase small subunit
MTRERAPSGLGKEGKKFWKQLSGEYDFETHHLKILENACHCLDRIEQAKEQIEKDGLYVPDRYGALKEHPAGKTERDNRALFARLLRELGLDIEFHESRPSRQY